MPPTSFLSADKREREKLCSDEARIGYKKQRERKRDDELQTGGRCWGARLGLGWGVGR